MSREPVKNWVATIAVVATFLTTGLYAATHWPSPLSVLIGVAFAGQGILWIGVFLTTRHSAVGDDVGDKRQD